MLEEEDNVNAVAVLENKAASSDEFDRPTYR